MKQIELKDKLYYVSSDGKVYDYKMNEMTLRIHRGRLYFKRYSIHRLVAKLYLEDFNPDFEVHHIDHCRTHNDVSNLVCISKSEHKKIHASDARMFVEEIQQPIKKYKKQNHCFNKKRVKRKPLRHK